MVVEVTATPLLPTRNDVGIDPGLTRLAVLSTGEVIDSPGQLRPGARALARPQRAPAKAKGSKRGARAAGRFAVQHRKVWDTRLDAHHRLAHRMVGDDQVIYVQDLAGSGLARTRSAKSVHEAGWAIRLLQERALRLRRSVVKVRAWFPSSPLCSAYGLCPGSKPPEVWSWTCPQCGAAHDRDVNAARNILVEGRKVATGLAETLNARGGGVRGGLVPTVACEARTRRGAA